jgi:uncharacterized protein (TIGR01244 family)
MCRAGGMTGAIAAIVMTDVNDRISVAGPLDCEDLRQARAAGIALVVDLRDDAEPVSHGLDPRSEAVVAAAIGLPHRRVPMGVGEPSRRAFAEIEAIVRGASGRVLLHCASGRRAAAAVVAVLGRADRWTPATCKGALRALGFDVAGMPPLGRAIVEYVTHGPADERVAGCGLGI